jgi:tRNA (uracil-5-)-methyltransferase
MQNIQIEQYDTLLNDKVLRIREQFAQFTPPEIEVFQSEVQHFRLRAEFKIWHEGERCFHAMFEKGTKNTPIEIKEFPIASKAITQLMPVLMDEINNSQTLKHRLFQLEYLSTLSGEMLVTMIYHRQLDDAWIAEAKHLKEKLGIHIIGRAKKLKILLDQDFVIEMLNVDGKSLRYKQIEGGFTQPNGKMNEKMLSWARSCVDGSSGDLLELYCGNGNFSIAMADKFRRVFATEISKTSVKAANDNKSMNNIDNVDFARVSAEEFTGHMNGVRKRRRLKDLNLEEADFQTVLVDPPRSGLDEDSCKMISEYPNIVYISCNPDTLKQNLEVLNKTHNIKRFAMFDQFPYTDHIECGIYLSKH